MLKALVVGDGHRAYRVFCFKDAETHEWVPAGRSGAGQRRNSVSAAGEGDNLGQVFFLRLRISVQQADVSIKYTMLYKRKANKKMGFHLFI